MGQYSASFLEESGLLYRKVLKRDGECLSELVVPAMFYQFVLRLAHSTALEGIRVEPRCETACRLSFTGLGLARKLQNSSDLMIFVRRRLIEEGSSLPLYNPCLSLTAFERVVEDIIGPIEPRANDGSKYIPTLWPKALPLWNKEANTVARAMLSLFWRIGVPKQVLSDRGTQFTSGMVEPL